MNVHVWLQIIIIHTLRHYTCSYIGLWELTTINVIYGWSVQKKKASLLNCIDYHLENLTFFTVHINSFQFF